MFDSAWASAHYFAERVASKPILWLIGLTAGFAIPSSLISASSLVCLVIIDTFSGRYAAYARGEEVTSSTMRRKILTKLQGYMVFIITAGLASAVVDATIILKGAFGLLGAVEFFSIAENLYDLDMLPVDPRKAPLFRGIVGMVKLRKRGNPKED